MTQENSELTDSDLLVATRVFQKLKEFPELKHLAKKRPLMRDLFQLALHCLAPSEAQLKAMKKDKKVRMKQDDKQVLDNTLIRTGRAKKLVGNSSGSLPVDQPPQLKTIADLEQYSVEHDALKSDSPLPEPAEYQRLRYMRSCHICPARFKDIHQFYDQLCPKCAEFNYAKRSNSTNMTGRVCLVTGARVKIGYCIALKLLRMGATVIVTTRFPHDAADRYAKEVDASFFSERLHIYGIDFRDVAMVHGFCSQIKLSFSRLDVIINNAAQTVRKPPKFYEHLLEAESRPVNIGSGKAAHVVDVYKQNGGNYLFLENSSDADVKDSENSVGFSASNSIRSFANVNTSAALSQVHFMQVDGEENNDALFPQGRLDRDDQQVDLRSENSWLLELGQVSTVEMLECHVINVFTPWILISELKSIMQATNVRPDGADKRCDKYIVNVSAMEGQFYRPKTIYHPHSNMAKAGLNMMTRTAAAGFAEISIFMTAVDTGWITDENPVDQWHKRENAPPPLDEFDAAMRVLDPVIEGMEGKEPVWGVFLKNYHATRW